MNELEKLQEEIELLKKEKMMNDRLRKLRQTKGSIRTSFTLYVHEITARYDDKIYITGSVRDSYYIKPRDERKPDDKGNYYTTVHLMFRKSTINGREFPADFIRKGDVVDVEALLTHGYRKLTDSEGNPVLVDGKEINVPTQPQYEGYEMKARRLTTETTDEYKAYIAELQEKQEKKKEENNKPVKVEEETTQTEEKPPVEEKEEKPVVEENNNTSTTTTSNNVETTESSDTLDLGNLKTFSWD